MSGWLRTRARDRIVGGGASCEEANVVIGCTRERLRVVGEKGVGGGVKGLAV